MKVYVVEKLRSVVEVVVLFVLRHRVKISLAGTLRLRVWLVVCPVYSYDIKFGSRITV